MTFSLERCLEVLERTPAVLQTLLGGLPDEWTMGLRAINLQPRDFDRTGIHPRFGEATLRQLLATWTVHDLDHLMLISRVMAKTDWRRDRTVGGIPADHPAVITRDEPRSVPA